MKIYLFAALLLFAGCATNLQNTTTTCFKGKLVKRGICGQRVIQLTSERTDGVTIAANWTDSLSGKQYENVFTVANPCDFPAAIKEGEEFTFSLTTTPGNGCATCFAYTPTPNEKNNIVTGCAQ